MPLSEEPINTLENTRRLLEDYKNNHTKASDDYERWFIKWVEECIILINEDIERERLINY